MQAILDPFPPMAKVTAMTNVFPYTGILRFLLSPKTQIKLKRKHPPCASDTVPMPIVVRLQRLTAFYHPLHYFRHESLGSGIRRESHESSVRRSSISMKVTAPELQQSGATQTAASPAQLGQSALSTSDPQRRLTEEVQQSIESSVHSSSDFSEPLPGSRGGQRLKNINIPRNKLDLGDLDSPLLDKLKTPAQRGGCHSVCQGCPVGGGGFHKGTML